MKRVVNSFADKAQWMRDQRLTVEQPSGTFAERHYSVADVAKMWNLSDDAVRNLFQDEQGVLVIGNSHSRSKRRYTTLRIPESVVVRVHRRMTKV